jgi:hypothetical protein
MMEMLALTTIVILSKDVFTNNSTFLLIAMTTMPAPTILAIPLLDASILTLPAMTTMLAQMMPATALLDVNSLSRIVVKMRRSKLSLVTAMLPSVPTREMDAIWNKFLVLK